MSNILYNISPKCQKERFRHWISASGRLISPSHQGDCYLLKNHFRRRPMSKFSRFSFASLFILMLISGLALAQTRVTGIVQGRVSDEEGSPLPGVNITVTSPGLMGTRSAVTDTEGKYRFATLPIGTYAVEASLQGLTSTKVTEVIVHANMTATVDIV